MVDRSDEPIPENTQHPSDTTVQEALAKVLYSSGFKGSERMRSFLSYVVQEALDGRQDAIRAKTIAMDVYGYEADQLAAREGVVRVDAGRVRRKLKAYYADEGADDTIRIYLPVGSYAPQFETTPKPDTPPQSKHTLLLGALGICAVLLIGLFSYQFLGSGPDLQTSIATGDQTSVYDVSPARVEAENLAEAGRGLLFPAVDAARLQPALLLFEAAIERDPHYHGGYAGAAQAETMLAILQFNQPAEQELLRAADGHSALALEIAPAAPWPLSSRAWLEFALGNYDRAQALSHRASALAPNDPHVAEFDALIALYTSDFDRILVRADEYLKFDEQTKSHVFGNALGAAQFHTGDYAAAIRSFDKTISGGGPFGPIAVAYIIAAHWRNGDHTEARRLAKVYVDTWPGFSIEAIKQRVFADQQPVEDLTSAVKAAGWQKLN